MSKQTKKALVPALRFPEFQDAGGWEEKTLGQVARYENGKAHEQDIAESGDFIVVNSKFISTDGEVKKFTNTAFCIAEKEDILIVLSDVPNGRAIAKCFFVDSDNLYTVNQRICKITPRKAASIILFYVLNRNSYFLEFDDGVKQTNLKKDDVLNCPILLPKDLKEQQKIADCLSSIDEVITAQTQKLDTLKAHKKGLMQQLFPAEGETVPKLRFEEFSGEWIPHKIGDFIESYKGGAALTPSDFASSSDCEVIPKKAISEGGWLKIDNEKSTYCNEEFYKKNLQSVIDSTYLITTLRDLVPSGPSIGYIVKYVGKKHYILAQGVYGLKPKNTILADFLIHFSNTDIYRKMMQSVMVGSTQVHIRNSAYLGLPISVPLLKEQQRIADCLSSIDELITAQTQKLAALNAHKKGLMQQLFPAMDEVAG